VGDQRDPGRIDGISVEESAAGRRGHDDHRIDGGQDPFQDFALVRRRIDEDGVEDDDDGNGEPFEDGENLVSVRAPVDAVFVLDHDGVEAVEDVGRLGLAARRTGHELMDHFGAAAALGPVDHPHHADPACRWACPELPRQGGRERGQPALSGRVGGEKSVAHGHRRHAPAGRAPATRRGEPS
jgi:hypothetical protein